MVNPDSRTAFMKRALSKEQPGGVAVGQPTQAGQHIISHKQSRRAVDSQSNLKRLQLMLNGQQKVMSEFGVGTSDSIRADPGHRQAKHSM